MAVVGEVQEQAIPRRYRRKRSGVCIMTSPEMPAFVACRRIRERVMFIRSQLAKRPPSGTKPSSKTSLLRLHHSWICPDVLPQQADVDRGGGRVCKVRVLGIWQTTRARDESGWRHGYAAPFRSASEDRQAENRPETLGVPSSILSRKPSDHVTPKIKVKNNALLWP